MNTKIESGKVFTLSGALAAGDQLTAKGGNHARPAGAVIQVTGTAVNDGTIALFAPGRTANTPPGVTGAQLQVTGTLTSNGFINIAGGGYSAGVATGATLVDQGMLFNTGSILVGQAIPGIAGGAGGLLIDSSLLDNTGIVTVAGGSNGAGGTLSVTGVFTNSDSLVIGAGGNTPATEGNVSIGATGVLIDSASMMNDGQVFIAAGGGLTIAAGGVLTNIGTIYGSGTVTNDGTIDSKHHLGFAGQINTAGFVNTGVVDIANGTAFRVGAAVSGTGLFDIGAHGKLSFGHAVAAGETIDLAGKAGTLGLADPSAFSGLLEGLAPGDTIDFLRSQVTSAIASGTTLEIGLASGTTLDLAMAAPLPSGTSLSLQSDGLSGTDVVFGHAG